ncbi:hypothetical protein OUZ56_026683 [Daphnia magna]|uniref:Uncharacterized protein n=1 Tax=Daphnia magna TaxID=35525 RepID=A0ABQ9ZMH0_9CRUS|nr:hypothetical protein OUZ56_026683 [Daphnia magna]
MPKTTGNEPPFEVKVLSFLSKIVGKLDQVKIEVDNLSISTQENEPLATMEIPLLPVKTIDELKLYEEVLTKDLINSSNCTVQGIVFKNASLSALEFETKKAVKNCATVLKKKQLGIEMESSESDECFKNHQLDQDCLLPFYDSLTQNNTLCSLIVERPFIRLAFGPYLAADVPNHLSGSSDVGPRSEIGLN